MKFITVERSIWLVLLVGLAAGTFYGANYIRDHEVYRATAAKCSADKSALGQEIEQLNAEVEKRDQNIEELKSLPIR